MTESEARRRARSIGWTRQVKEPCRDVRPLRWLSECVRDVRLGFRGLRRDSLALRRLGHDHPGARHRP